MKKYLLLFPAILMVLFSMAQKTGMVKGIVYDTIAKEPVPAATISLLKRKDSSLVAFTMTNEKGQFALNGLEKGDYRLLVTHINYHNGNKYFSVTDSTKNIDLGHLVLNDKTKVLKEIVIKAEEPPVTLVGDTIQYNAGSFRTKPNAVVEDLLKKLPGVQVEKDGTVKAQGEKVNKMLVDGKEFFGNDPKIATKNLPADAVDKVQVFDKQSDMAQLTGFNDGNYEKTINLKLKKDKKKGAFGKVSAGGGTDGRYAGRFNVNSFKGARQLSVLGLGNNTNADGFSFMDILNFSGELGRMNRGGGGNINISIDNSDPITSIMGGANGNRSINTSWASGLNYNNIIGNKTEFNGSYFYNHYNPVTDTRLSREYVLPGSAYFYNQQSGSDNRSDNHRLNFTVDYVIDSMHSLKFTPTFSYQESNNYSENKYETLTGGLEKSNSGISKNGTKGNGYNFKNDILFRKKFNKHGRTFSFNLNTDINNSGANGMLSSINEFYNSAGSLIQTDSINQRNNNKSDSKGYVARAVYTEPLFRRSLLELSISNGNTFAASGKETYDYNNSNGKFDNLNPLLSNDYENTYGTNTAGIRWRTQRKKFSYAFGLTWQNASLEGKIISGIKDSVIHKDFYNLLPNAQFRYQFARFKNLTINYRATTNQPSVLQLQPVADITDPLNIKEGNPGLKQEYLHGVQLMYSGINPFRGKSFFVFGNFSFTNNRIVNYDVIDTLGRKFSRPVNVDGVYNFNTDFSLGWPLKFMKAALNFNSGFGYSKDIRFINTAENTIHNYRIGPQAQINKTIKEKLDISVSSGLTFNRAKYSLQPALDNDYLTQDYGLDVGWQLPKNFYLASEFNYIITSQRSAGYNAKVPLWKASFSKLFLKYNRGEIKLSVFDILNKNLGIARNTTENYIEDISSRVLKRYFMLSFTYSLSKMSANTGSGGEIKVIRR